MRLLLVFLFASCTTYNHPVVGNCYELKTRDGLGVMAVIGVVGDQVLMRSLYKDRLHGMSVSEFYYSTEEVGCHG